MAKDLIKTSGSIFMGNPITFRATAEAEPSGAPVSFHRIKLRVVISEKVFELSSPVESGGSAEFDISSCFRAVADGFVYSPLTSGSVSYPEFIAQVEARDVWLRDGQLIDPAPSAEAVARAECTAIMGRYSDFERCHPTQSLTFTRKPLAPERVEASDGVVYALDRSSIVRPISPSELGTTIKLPTGQQLYVDHHDPGSYMFQFVNSRGVIESVRSHQLITEIVKGSSQEHTISVGESFHSFSRIYASRQPDRLELRLSSGFVSYDWARWWAYEFCASPTHWILIDSIWLPCIIMRDESLTLIDRTKPGMCYVQLTCKPNINGGMW